MNPYLDALSTFDSWGGQGFKDTYDEKKAKKKKDKEKKSPPIKERGFYERLDNELGGWLPGGVSRQESQPTKLPEPENPLLRALGLGADAISSGVTLGLSDLIPDAREITPRNTAEKIISGGGELLGSLLPVNAAYGLASKLPQLANMGKYGQALTKGALAGAGTEGLRSTIEGNSLPQIGQDALLGAALFGGGDVALKGLGSLFNVARPGALENLSLTKSFPQLTGTTRTPLLPEGKPILPEAAPLQTRPGRFEAPQISSNPLEITGNTFNARMPQKHLSGLSIQSPVNDSRMYANLGYRKQKKLDPFMQETNILQGELRDSIKGQRFSAVDEMGNRVYSGTPKYVSESIGRIMDETGASYKQIGEALNRIMRGLPDNSLSGKIKPIIEERLTNGYKSFEGMNIPPNKAYLRGKMVDTPAQQQPQQPNYELEIARQKLQQNPAKAEAILKAYPELAGEVSKVRPQVKPGPTKTTAGDTGAIPQTEATIQGDIPKFSNVDKINNAPGTAETFDNKISWNPPKKKGSFGELMGKLRTQFVDDLAPIENLEKNVRGKIESAEKSPYKTARLFRGVPTKANEVIRTRLKPIIDNIEKQGYNYKDLSRYALAVHARDVNSKGMVSGFTNQEIVNILNKYGTRLEPARQELVKYSTELLNELANSGVIDANLVNVLRQKWPNYMPLFRELNDSKVEFSNGLSKALVNATNPIKRLEGSTKEVINPIESLVKNTFQTINAAEKNRVAQQIAQLAKDDMEGNFVRRLPGNTDRERLNTIYVRENGKKVYYEVEPDVYKALMSLDRESSNFLIKILQKPASLLRAGATLTPEFSFRNPIRDVPHAFVVSKSGFNPILDLPVGLFQAIVKGRKIRIMGKEFTTPGQLYENFLKDSGGYGNIMSMDRKVHQEALRQVIKEPASKKFVNVISGKSLIGLLRTIADISETATKLGEYRAAIRNGASRPEAAYRARDIMDFARAGSSVREANKVVAFANASIQGKSKTLRTFKEQPIKTMGKAITAITIPTVAAYLAQKYLSNEIQQKTIQDAPTWLRDSFWLVPIPGTNLVARIPKPFDLAPPFANLPERLLNYIDTNDPQAFDNFAKETFASYSIPVMLTGMAPFVEGFANYSFFRQAPIIPQREQDLNYPDQYDINTSEVAKATARGVNKLTDGEGAFRNFGSPRIIDNTIQGLTAGLGKLATGAVDLALEKTGAVDKPEKPARKLNEYPVARAFLVNDTGGGKAMSDLYDLKEKLTKEKGSAKANKNLFKDAGKLRYIEGITGRIGEITKLMRQTENNQRMSATEKRNRLNKLNKNRNDLAVKAMERLNK